MISPLALSEADTRAKLIDPAIHACGWSEDLICRETTLGQVDLSDVKVGKKTPLTLKHFEDFAAKLATREDSDRSWTIDLAARKAKASADAQPFKDVARTKSQEAERVRDQLG